MVGFQDAVRMFFNRYTDFKTRSTRAEYWWVQLALLIVFGILFVLFAMLGGAESQPGPVAYIPMILMAILGLAIIVPAIALTVRRFHDAGLSGWIYLLLIVLSLIPILGLLASIASLVITVLPSKPANQWGRTRTIKSATSLSKLFWAGAGRSSRCAQYSRGKRGAS